MTIYHSIAGFALTALMYGVMLFAALEPVSPAENQPIQIAAPAVITNAAA